jgi:hypothetical protein
LEASLRNQFGKLMLYQLSYSRPLSKSHTCGIHANFVPRVAPVVPLSQ